MSQDSFEIYPLFSKPVYVNYIDLDFKKIISKFNKYKVHEAGSHSKYDTANNISYTSFKKNVLDSKDWFFLTKKINKHLDVYANEFLKYKNKFKMTTSWFTQTKPNQTSNYHHHRNSMISCVLYIQCDKKSGDITFIDYKTDDLFELEIKEHNIYNSISFDFFPKPGMILFFPSQLYHRVLTNESNIDRFSIACNFIPVGQLNNTISDSNFYMKE
jgi:uncharacterized protein (TIGR02466 family)